MASIAEQIDYFRTLANYYAAETLATVNSYRIMMATQIQIYSVWFATLVKQSYWATVTKIANARDWFVSLITSGWLKQQALWLMDIFIRGFWKGYNAVTSLANLLIRLSRELIKFIKYLPELFLKIADHIVHFIKAYYKVAKIVLNHVFDQLHFLAVQFFNGLVRLISNLPTHLARSWHIVINALITIKDAAVTLANHLGTFFVNHALPFIRSLASAFMARLATLMGVISGFLAGVTEIVMSGITKTIALTFGLSAAIVDVSFDLMGFLYSNTLGTMLPTLPSMPLVAASLPFVKAGLTVGLVGLGCYGTYKACKKLYPIADNFVRNQLIPLSKTLAHKFMDAFDPKNSNIQRIDQPRASTRNTRSTAVFAPGQNYITNLYNYAVSTAFGAFNPGQATNNTPAAITPLRDVRKSAHQQIDAQEPARRSNRKRNVA